MSSAKNTTDPRQVLDKPPYPEQTQDTPGVESQMQPKADHGESSYKGSGKLTSRIALITGGDSGIGRAVALAFAREGADVVVSYLNEHEDAEGTKKLVEDSGRSCVSIPGDIGDDKHCQTVVQETINRFGRIDILINNAAFMGKTVETMDEFSPERVEKTFRTNIISMFHMVKQTLPHMSAGGVIINTTSIQAYQPEFRILDYAATKGAIVTFTKGLANKLIKQGIRVNAVAPGPVWTPFIPQSFSAEETAHFGEDWPMQRPAQPAELAPSFVFLASEDGRYVVGEILGVTGAGGLP
ncbi:MAG: SDR family oxidoreductase [Rivularia sp. T60_A2020_040]|nr:SDR family oxidoreductase [Rivularia sp. T60_A2020_040]